MAGQGGVIEESAAEKRSVIEGGVAEKSSVVEESMTAGLNESKVCMMLQSLATDSYRTLSDQFRHGQYVTTRASIEM